MSVETEVTVISSLPKHHRFPFVSLCDGEPWLLPPQQPEPETAVLLTGFTRPGGRDKSEAEVRELSAARGEVGGPCPSCLSPLLWELVQGIGRENLLLGETVRSWAQWGVWGVSQKLATSAGSDGEGRGGPSNIQPLE